MKKTRKAKEPVKIRFKELANGNKSVYLDIYQNGRRQYEFLKLYLIPETDIASRTKNDNTMTAARKIQAERVIELTDGKAGIKKVSKMMLFEWLEKIAEEKNENGQSDARGSTIRSLGVHLKEFLDSNDIPLSKIDAEFCRKFISYLSTAKILVERKGQKVISAGSSRTYFSAFKMVLNEAERRGIITENPSRKLSRQDIKPIAGRTRERVYLSLNELRSLEKTDCKKNNIKKAFLFACFCGLRISDIRSLIWDELKMIDGTWFVVKRMKKTNDIVSVPLDMAQRYLPNRGGACGKDKIFELPSSCQVINTIIRQWAEAAGIEKSISFHTSRHTFATLLLSAGADLYTTSKLLGHKNLSTTQIYAKIVDAKKKNAINLLVKMGM